MKLEKVAEAGALIESEPPDDIGYMHAVLSQIGLPRSKFVGPRFERTSGRASLVIESGRLWNGRAWIEQDMPYGTKPRLMLCDLFTHALRNKTTTIPMGDSVSDYLARIGLTSQGGATGPLTLFRKQAQALAASRMTLGLAAGGMASTISGQPIRKFSAWFDAHGHQKTLWPATLELSRDFYDSLKDHAVPLDLRAVRALSNSSLAIDLYTWLAHRLYRLRGPAVLHWKPLREQFGQEYSDPRDFKKEVVRVLPRVLTVYPDARVQIVTGGLRVEPSKPPIPEVRVAGVIPKKL